MSEFFNSFVPIIKHLKKHKLEMIFILIAVILTIISASFLVFSLNYPNTTDDIVINKNDNYHQRNIYVDVGGAVVKPDMYEVTSGARLKQVVMLSGGLSEYANKDYFYRNFNLARIITDQEKIYIPSILEVNNGIITENPRTLDYSLPTLTSQEKQLNTSTLFSASNSTIEQPVLININSSSIEELDTLPGIGTAAAQKIIQNRPYKSIEELLSKKVLKKNIYEQIKALISLN